MSLDASDRSYTVTQCPGRSQSPCPKCGKCVGLFEVCSCSTDDISVSKLTAEQLYDELGKFKWLGTDDWNLAVVAIRNYISKGLVHE